MVKNQITIHGKRFGFLHFIFHEIKDGQGGFLLTQLCRHTTEQSSDGSGRPPQVIVTGSSVQEKLFPGYLELFHAEQIEALV